MKKDVELLVNKIAGDPVAFVRAFSKMTPYDYQEKFLRDESRHIIVKKGRQVGASQMAAWKFVYKAFTNPDYTILVISPSQRQSNLFFKKMRKFAYHPLLKRSLVGDSWNKIEITNGAEIYSLPSGETGATIRGFKGDELGVDEGAFMREAVWNAIEDSTLRGGNTTIISTPMGTSNRFYDYYHKKGWSKHDIPSTRCPDITPEEIERKKEVKPNLEFRQEILGEFVTTATLWYDPEVIKECRYGYDITGLEGELYLALDPARHGADSGVIMEGRLIYNFLFITRVWAWNRKPLTHYLGEMRRLHQENNYKKVLVDDTGLGGGIIDFVDENEPLHAVLEGITFTPDKKSLLYTNLLKFSEDRKVLLPENHRYTPEIMRQWSSIERETTKTGKSRATSRIRKDDFVDALALLTWGVRQPVGTSYFRSG